MRRCSGAPVASGHRVATERGMRSHDCRQKSPRDPETAVVSRHDAGTAVAARPPTRNGLGLQQDGISVHRPSRIRQNIRLSGRRCRQASRRDRPVAQAGGRRRGSARPPRDARYVRAGIVRLHQTQIRPGEPVPGLRRTESPKRAFGFAAGHRSGARLQRDGRVCGATKRIRQHVPLHFPYRPLALALLPDALMQAASAGDPAATWAVAHRTTPAAAASRRATASSATASTPTA